MFKNNESTVSFVHPEIQEIMIKLPSGIWKSSIVILACTFCILFFVAYGVKSPVSVFLKTEGALVDNRVTALLPNNTKKRFMVGLPTNIYVTDMADNKTAIVKGKIESIAVSDVRGNVYATILANEDERKAVRAINKNVVNTASVVVYYKPLVDKIFE